jgi:signal transduction histidine kinase
VADAAALASAAGVLVALRADWSRAYTRADLVLAWVAVGSAGVAVFVVATVRRPPRLLGAGFVAAALVLPAIAVLDLTSWLRTAVVASAALFPLAAATFAGAVLRRSWSRVTLALLAVTIIDVMARLAVREPSVELPDRALALMTLAWCVVAVSQVAAMHVPATKASAALAVVAGGLFALAWLIEPGVTVGDVSDEWVQPLLFALIAPAFLFAAAPGLLAWRTRHRVRTLASDLSSGLEAGGVAGHLRRAMTDPSVRLVFPVADGHYIDSAGTTTEVARHRATTVLAREGEPIAIVEHAPSSVALIGAAVNPAVTIAAENERLHAEAEAHLAELQLSRRRIVERADETRRRLERDLHDGAQQQLLLLGLELSRAAEAVESAERDKYVAALQHAQGALHELRRLVHDALPPVLDELGLVEALRSLAEESPVPLLLELDDVPARRPELAVERVAFRVVLSSLAEAEGNDATAVSVRLDERNGWFVVSIRHDGLGVADRTDDEDRVGALGGRLDVVSVEGGVECVVAFS